MKTHKLNNFCHKNFHQCVSKTSKKFSIHTYYRSISQKIMEACQSKTKVGKTKHAVGKHETSLTGRFMLSFPSSPIISIYSALYISSTRYTKED